VNDGWDKNAVNPSFGISQWLANPPLPPHTVPFITLVASISRSPPKEHIFPSHEIQMDNGKIPITIPSPDTSQSSYVHSKHKSKGRKW
jgi:hypothetical protein